MTLGDLELLRGHVHSHDLALGADELRKEVNVAARSASEIEHPAALEQGRVDEAAAVIAHADLGVDLGKERLEPGRNNGRVAAGVGLEVGRTGSCLP
jgi:hypothetical protein